MMAAPFLLLRVAITVFSAVFFSQMSGGGASVVPAVYVFGDSTADVGNNNYLAGSSAHKANFPHYGIDYPHRKPTGRFSNGYIGVDFLAKKMGFKRSPPPFLSLMCDAQMFKGVNFASGGSGILDTTGENVSISMNDQVRFFEGVTRRLTTRMGKPVASLFLSKSLFLIGTGNNDMINYYINFGPHNDTQLDQFIGAVACQFKDQLKTLYGLGARKFGVFGASHIGCIPFIRRTTPSGGCIELLNGLARRYNRAMEALLHDVATTSSGLMYSYIDVFEVMSMVTAKPLRYGFKELETACCGSGRFNGESACMPNTTYCSDRREYFFWDWSHPTQATSKLVSTLSYEGTRRFATPVNVKQLVGS